MATEAASKLKQIVEAALMAADEPLTVDQLSRLFPAEELDPDEARGQIRDALEGLESETEGRGYELKRVASGYRYQVRQELSEWVSRLWEEKPPRYSRALLETLALIAYKQPVTRGDIEQVRGVSVSQNIMRTLQERGWIRVVGQREVPGKPSLYGTTRAFLDYFDLKSLDQLPPLTEIHALVEPLVLDEVVAEPAPGPTPQNQTEPPADAGTQQAEQHVEAETGPHGAVEAAAGAHEAFQRRDEEQDERQRSESLVDGQEQGKDGQQGEERKQARQWTREPDEAETETQDEDGAEQSAGAEVVRLPTNPRR